MNPVPDTLVRLGGGDQAAMELVPSARAAFIQIAVALLVTASMATVSMWFALHDALHVHWLGAALVAPFWGVVILGMDRTLMVLGMGGGAFAMFASVVGRVLAAVLIGIVVSTPLTLRMFASDIDAELAKIQAAQSETNKSWVAGSQEKQRVVDLEQQVHDWESIAAGVLPASFADSDSSKLTAELSDLEKKLAKDEHAADQADILYNCDTYGGGREKLDKHLRAKCAKKPGPNGNSDKYKREANNAAGVVDETRAKIKAVQAKITSTNTDRLESLKALAAGRLASLRPQLEEARAALVAFEQSIEGANRDNTGLLAQLAALWKAGAENRALMVAHIVVALLFVLIEVLPVMAKLLWHISPSGKAYEESVRSFDDDGVATAQTRRVQAQIQAETAYEAALITKDAELDRRQLDAEHEQELIRIQLAAEVRLEQARAEDVVAMGTAIDAEFAALREAELRRRAEAGFAAWASRVGSLARAAIRAPGR